MDIEMPGGDELTATREILARCPATRVLVLTTFDLDDYVFQAMRAGASGFLLKTTPPRQTGGGGSCLRRRGNASCAERDAPPR